jgi:predicted kinase
LFTKVHSQHQPLVGFSSESDNPRIDDMATLHFITGRAGSGKTTFARQLAARESALLVCQDEWLSKLAEPIENLPQYVAAARKVRSVIAPLTVDLLRLGTSVVFDFAGNTAQDRAWVRSIFEEARAEHVLHFLVVADATCRARVKQRNELQPPGLFFGVVTEPQLDDVNRFFDPPSSKEGFKMVVYRADE